MRKSPGRENPAILPPALAELVEESSLHFPKGTIEQATRLIDFRLKAQSEALPSYIETQSSTSVECKIRSAGLSQCLRLCSSIGVPEGDLDRLIEVRESTDADGQIRNHRLFMNGMANVQTTMKI